MACAGFLRSLWEKPIWEGFWPFLDPIDSVCLRTASVEWNVPGNYGPHGDLFFFLIKKELASVPSSETFSPFFAARDGCFRTVPSFEEMVRDRSRTTQVSLSSQF